VDYTPRTLVRGGEDRCRRCAWDAAGGLVLGQPYPPSHTCLSHETPGQAATRERQQHLDRINRVTRRRTR
jgi:hypothetical protein